MKQWHSNLDDERVEMIFNFFLMCVGVIGSIMGALITFYLLQIMTAEQGIQIYHSVFLQIDANEQNKFNELILERVEQRESRIKKCLASLDKKYTARKRLRK